MKNLHLHRPLLAACVLLSAACDTEEARPLELVDVIDDIDGATTGEVEPLAVDPEIEDQLELVSVVEFPDPDADVDFGEFELAAELDPREASPLGYWSWGTPGNNGQRLYLGSASNRTCFLQGITGELESAQNSASARAGVYIDNSNNQWYIETKAGVPEFWGEGGDGVMAHATCIPNTTNRQFISWVGNSSSGSNTLYAFAEDHGNTRCFLSAVSGTTGWASGSAWAGLRPGTRDGEPTWELGGNLIEEADGSSGGGAAAVCVDISFQSTGSYSWQASSTASAGQLTSSTVGQTCAIHSLTGNFAANTYGWSDGVRIFPSSSSSGDRWYLFGTLSKKVTGECYKNFSFWPSWP